MTAHQLTIEPVELPSARQIAQKLATVALLVGVGIVVAHPAPRRAGHRSSARRCGRRLDHRGAHPRAGLDRLLRLAFHGVYDRRPGPRASTSMSLAVQGMNIVLPSGGAGGLAVGAVLLDRAGVPRSFAASRTVALFLVTSLVSFAAVVIAGFGVASGRLAGEAKLALTLLPGALALLAIVAVFALRARAVRSNGAAGRLRRAVASARSICATASGASAELLRSGDRLVIAGAIGYFAFDVAALAAAFHAVGSAGLPIGLLVLAYTLGARRRVGADPRQRRGRPDRHVRAVRHVAPHRHRRGARLPRPARGRADAARRDRPRGRPAPAPRPRPSEARSAARPRPDPALPDQVCAITSTTVRTASATPPTVKTPTVRNASGTCAPVLSACSSSRCRCAPDDQQSHRQRRVAAAQHDVWPCADCEQLRGEPPDAERADRGGQRGAPPRQPGALRGHRRAPRLIEVERRGWLRCR